MKRYIDLRNENWTEKLDTRMQAARWTACMNGIGDAPPLAGVIDGYPAHLLRSLLEAGWAVPYPTDAPVAWETLDGDSLRAHARVSVLATLTDDVDCLATREHTLIERLLIGEGSAPLDGVSEIEAAYTLRMRMWCDVGMEDDTPVARLDAALVEALPKLLLRKEHQDRRDRIFIFEGMMHGILYITGFIDDESPRARFIREVLETEDSPRADRLARNFMEASFDTYPLGSNNLIVHEALADPQMLAEGPALGALQVPEVTGAQMAGSMNGLLPEEAVPDEALQRALYGALRPEYEPYEAASDLRFLAKQSVPLKTMQDIMASMLVVLPTQHMESALSDMRRATPRWISAERRPDGMMETLH